MIYFTNQKYSTTTIRIIGPFFHLTNNYILAFSITLCPNLFLIMNRFQHTFNLNLPTFTMHELLVTERW